MGSKVVAEISVVPLGTATTSLSEYVAGCLKILEEAKDIKFQLTAMGTIIEGSLEQVLAVVQQMHQIPFDLGCQRVLTTIKIDDRRDKAITIDSKVEAVAKKIKRGASSQNPVARRY